MSKTFNSQINPGRKLTVTVFAGRLNLTIMEPTGGLGVSLSPEDALALADEVHKIQARLDDARRAKEAEEATRVAEAKLTERRNKYVRDIHERAGWHELSDGRYEFAPCRLQAAVDLLIERDDELIAQEASNG